LQEYEQLFSQQVAVTEDEFLSAVEMQVSAECAVLFTTPRASPNDALYSYLKIAGSGREGICNFVQWICICFDRSVSLLCLFGWRDGAAVRRLAEAFLFIGAHNSPGHGSCPSS